MHMLADMTWPQLGMAFLLIVVCLFLMLVILIQRGRGGGLVGAFGGSSGQTFGAKTGDVFTWITVGFAAVFVLLSVFGNYAFDQSAAPVVATSSEATSVPIEVPPGGTPPIPPNAIPIDMPPTAPGQSQTIKIGPGTSGAQPITVTPVAPGQVPPAVLEAAEKAKAGTGAPPAAQPSGNPPPAAPATPPAAPAGEPSKPAEPPKAEGEQPKAP